MAWITGYGGGKSLVAKALLERSPTPFAYARTSRRARFYQTGPPALSPSLQLPQPCELGMLHGTAEHPVPGSLAGIRPLLPNRASGP